MFLPTGEPRPHYKSLHATLESLTARDFKQRAQMAEMSMLNQGVTFTVYGDNQGLEKTMPVDLVPRIITHDEWVGIERGLIQRLRALNCFCTTSITIKRYSKTGSCRVSWWSMHATSGANS